MSGQAEFPNTPPRSFRKPSLIEVEHYASRIRLEQEEAHKFFNYYESNGWRVGKNPMKNWHASLSYWKSNCDSRKSPRGRYSMRVTDTAFHHAKSELARLREELKYTTREKAPEIQKSIDTHKLTIQLFESQFNNTP